ncbi:MAG: DUF2190 family protein [Thermoguttaceae bacterium]|nr:DUF2190 family protein [Thermoguttaceae bacterium]
MAVAVRKYNAGAIDWLNDAGETLESGAVVVGNLVGCLVRPTAPGEVGTLETDGVWEFPKGAESFSVGAACYWDDATETIVSTGDVCVEEAASDAATVSVALNYRAA